MNILQKCYDWCFCWTPILQSILTAAVRVVVGSQFLLSGWHKLNSLGETAHFFGSLNIPDPAIMAVVVGTLEAVCGAFLILGLLSRLVSIPLIFIMLGAYSTAHPEAYESYRAFVSASPFLPLLGCLLILAFGPGAFSLDYTIRRPLR